VTLQGCVRDRAERRKLVAFVKAQRGVEKVFDDLIVGTKLPPKRPAGGAPAPVPPQN
jgi:osmotically-inducible protein OsmY